MLTLGPFWPDCKYMLLTSTTRRTAGNSPQEIHSSICVWWNLQCLVKFEVFMYLMCKKHLKQDDTRSRQSQRTLGKLVFKPLKFSCQNLFIQYLCKFYSWRIGNTFKKIFFSVSSVNFYWCQNQSLSVQEIHACPSAPLLPLNFLGSCCLMWLVKRAPSLYSVCFCSSAE